MSIASIWLRGAAATGLFVLGGCAGFAPGGGGAAAGLKVDSLLAEVEAAEAEAPAPAPEWIELPLPDGVFSEGADLHGGQRISIPVPAFSALEYKLEMKAGDRIAYRWRAEGLSDPDLLLSEFHGHTERQPGEPGTVMFYSQGTRDAESGVLSAPFDGIHGWYLKNDSEDDVTVRLIVAGDYEIVPGQLQ